MSPKPILLALTGLWLCVTPAAAADPIIDMHLHALAADDQGPPPLAMCTPISPMPTWDQRQPWTDGLIGMFKTPGCADPIWSPTTDDEIRDKTLAIMAKRNIIGVVSGPYKRVMAWRALAPDRVLPALMPTMSDLSKPKVLQDDFGKAKAAGQLAVLGELGFQYEGIAPNDPRLENLWTAAEQLDIPVAIHVGPGPPGVAYMPGSGYRARLSSPLLLEDVLVKHPKLRINVMHAGYPMLDDTLALLYAHPQVYLDTGVIVYTQPRPAFYRYLQALVDAGFGERVMFGSDQMVWPEAIERSIAVIDEAPFLTPQQKRDILYNNAARFLRLDAATIAKHKAM
ncbi:amidohydrolase family protein [Caulobacter henricii]|uniref:Metal-dependent hydrolase n=1 Tax=Caulobacter henricii TaxID=69395 RepID=A0A0P0P2T2_9CAUL|nr:amidohydrolase family protein [Caulobacter henricii]ALL14492.1 metal-dependent hydrolase [Caulobacter henricii]